MSYMPIEVELGKDGGTKQFSSFKEVVEWAQTESDYWRWLLSPDSDVTLETRQLCNPVAEPFRRAFQQIQQHATEAIKLQDTKNAVADNALANCAAKVKETFKEYYDRKGILFSGTERAKFVTRLKEDNGFVMAAAACGYFIKIPLPHTSIWVLKGVLEASYREHGFVDQRADHATALEELRRQWSQDIESSRALTTEAETKLSGLAVQGQSQLDKQAENYKHHFEHVEGELKAKIAAVDREWDDKKKALGEDMKLRASVDYWTTKARWHFAVLLAIAGLAVGLGYYLLPKVIIELEKFLTIPSGLKDPEKWHPHYSQIAVVIALGAVGVWFARVILRLFFSNVHLHSDAMERVTMVKTYLALVSEGKAPQDDDRKLMLQSLFRPASTGLLKEDAVPWPGLDKVTKAHGRE